jgi:hypothetical protein
MAPRAARRGQPPRTVAARTLHRGELLREVPVLVVVRGFAHLVMSLLDKRRAHIDDEAQ